jgi:uncharacterized C2H2 Zn-finger protein
VAQPRPGGTCRGGENAVGTVTIRCPRTGRQVSTGLELDEATWDSLPVVLSRMTCPSCGAEHVWSKTYARYVTTKDPAIPAG